MHSGAQTANRTVRACILVSCVTLSTFDEQHFSPRMVEATITAFSLLSNKAKRQSTRLALSQPTALGSGAHLRSRRSWAASEHTLQPMARSTQSPLTTCSAVCLHNPLLHGLPYYSFYQLQKDERLSRPSWLAYSGQFTHISGYPSAVGRA